MFGKRSLTLTILTLFGAAYLFSVVAGSNPEQFTFPSEMAGLKLGHFSQGEEAMAKISKLHGREIAIKNGYVAHYESDQARAMLYISESESKSQARQQIDLMRENIEKGTKNFGHFKKFEVEDLSASQPQKAGRTIYSVWGMGQVHYFYLVSNRVVWLAADPSVAESVLKATLKMIK